VLVLGAGGILGEAWMSAVLAGIAEENGFDPRQCRSYLGTSAGSIVAAMLCSGMHPRESLGRMPEQPETEAADPGAGPSRFAALLRGAGAMGGAATKAVAPALLRGVTPGGGVVRRVALNRVPRGRRSLAALGRGIDESGADWDGRLRIAAVELETGRRVIFDGTGEPRLSVGEAVQASCAIPGVFRPLEAGGHTYVDGGAWSLTNMDAVEATAGTKILCLNPTGGIHGGRIGPLAAIRTLSRSGAGLEAAAMRRRGARVMVVAPDSDAARELGSNFMDGSNRSGVHAAGLAQGRRLAREGR
jgi:NTE family protein